MIPKEEIEQKAIEIIEKHPECIKFGELVKEIIKENPNILNIASIRTVQNIVVELGKTDKVYKPARGLFCPIKSKDIKVNEEKQKITTLQIKEEDLYQPFADWLKSPPLEECTKAIPVGGNKFGDKWATPDVIGIREAEWKKIVIPTEIVSAEIKVITNSNNLLEGFAQACAYKLFSHKSYLVIPQTSSEEDIGRLGAMCIVLGIGLVLFNVNESKEPEFEIKARAIKHEPDMFYVDKYIKLIERELFAENK